MQEKPLNQLDDTEVLDLNITGENGITASDFSTIDLSGVAAQTTFTLDTMNYDTISYSGGNITSITLPSTSAGGSGGGGGTSQYNFSNSGTGGGGYTISTGTGNYIWNTTTTAADPSIHITQGGIDMPAEADIKIGDRSLKEFMTKMEDRMAILVPDPKKLEKFAALKKAYEHYKLMERLCQTDDEKDT